MKNNQNTTYKWAFLPFVFSSAVIVTSSVVAAPGASKHYKDARQTNSANYQYVGGSTQAGFGVTDQGDLSVDFNHVFSETTNSSTSGGIWAGVDLTGDDKGIKGRGVQVNHNWVSRNKKGRATHVNKVFGAYDRSEAGHSKVTAGYGQEAKDLFWEGHASKGLSERKGTGTGGISNKGYDYGVGGSVGTYLKESNMRIRGGLDYEWGDDLGVGESRAKNTTFSAGVEKFVQGTGHSVGLDVAASKQRGGYNTGSNDTDLSGKVSYHYDFGGSRVYQPDRRYKRVRVEVPGKASKPRYVKKAQYKRVAQYKNIPTYAKKNVRQPYKQLVKSTMELEGQTFFKLNSSKLIPSAQTRLKQIAAQIRKTGYKGSIRITGNTCGLGNAAYDQRLSEQRARSVRAFLIKSGFNAAHLTARGLGKDHPKFPNTPDQGFKNRRVDIEYVSEQKSYKTAYRNVQKNVQTGTRRVANGFKNVPAGFKNVMVSSGKAGAPRVIWKTKAIPTAPSWIKRALHNNIQHNTNVNTYQTTAVDGPSTSLLLVANDDLGIDVASCTDKTINVLGNDENAVGSTITIASMPSHGAVEVVDGKVVYSPEDDYTGADSFTYTITDANGNASTATVSLNVSDSCNTENTAPVANNDSGSTTSGDSVTVNVLGNDTDADDDDLTITGYSQGSNGSVVLEGGKLVYTANDDFTGEDTFTYTVSDGNGGSATATVTVTVTGDGCNTCIHAEADDATTTEGMMVVIPVLANDTGTGLMITAVDTPNNGTAVIVGNTIEYTPNAGYVGSDSFWYDIKDSSGAMTAALIYVDVCSACSAD